jgi:hypothetical protein
MEEVAATMMTYVASKDVVVRVVSLLAYDPRGDPIPDNTEVSLKKGESIIGLNINITVL